MWSGLNIVFFVFYDIFVYKCYVRFTHICSQSKSILRYSNGLFMAVKPLFSLQAFWLHSIIIQKEITKTHKNNFIPTSAATQKFISKENVEVFLLILFLLNYYVMITSHRLLYYTQNRTTFTFFLCISSIFPHNLYSYTEIEPTLHSVHIQF